MQSLNFMIIIKVTNKVLIVLFTKKKFLDTNTFQYLHLLKKIGAL